MKTNLAYLAIGVNKDIAAKCSPSTQSTLTKLGYATYIPVVTGAIGAFLLSVFFTDKLFVRLLITLIWGLVVFLVEGVIMHQFIMNNKKNVSYYLRWVLAVAMGFIVSTMFALQIFRADIKKEIETMSTNEQSIIASQYDELIKREQDSLRIYREKVESAQTELHQELDGTGGSRIRNYGPVAKEKEKARDDAKKVLEEQKEIVNQRVAELEDQKRAQLNNTTVIGGVIQQLDMLWKITFSSISSALFRISLLVVLFSIEVTAVVTAAYLGGGEYRELASMDQKYNVEFRGKESEIAKEVGFNRLEANLIKERMHLDTENSVFEMRMQLESMKNKADILLESVSIYKEALDKVEKLEEGSKKEELKSKIASFYNDFLNSLPAYHFPVKSATL